MQQIASQCTNCGLFARRSLHHEEEYQNSVLLERLRTSNSSATDEEIAHIRLTILPIVSDDISSIDSKLASLHAVITSMEEERARLKEVQDKYNNLISSHRALPMEIWSEIFSFMVPIPSETNAFDAWGHIWQLSHVCQRWRNLALSLGLFWSTLELEIPTAAQCEGDVERLQTVMQRSREGLLDVSLCDDRPTYSYDADANPSILKRMLDIVLEESYRWREFHLSDKEGNLNMLYASLHAQLPRLETLTLHCALPKLEENSAALVYKDCPCLTKLALSRDMLSVEFPWNQLTELDLSHMEFYEDDVEEERRACMRLIGQCPSLEFLSTPTLDSADDDDDESVYTPVKITCLNMRKLDAASVLVTNVLTLPRLQEAFIHSDFTRCDILAPFKRLLIRSSCFGLLTRLSIGSVPLAASPEHSLLSILSHTQNLISLDLTVSMHYSDYNRAIAVSNREQTIAILKSLRIRPMETVTFLPRLSSLVIRIQGHDDELDLLYFGPVGSFVSMLKERWTGDNTIGGWARLQTCHFDVHAKYLANTIHREFASFESQHCVPETFTEAERLAFKALIDDGMDLVIRITSDYRESAGGNEVFFSIRG